MSRVPPNWIHDGRLLPLFPHQRPGEYRPIPRGNKHRSPTIWINAWIDHGFKNHGDSEGEPLYGRIVEGLLNIGLVSSVGFRLTNYRNAQFRFHFTDKDNLCRYSYNWDNYVTDDCSTLFAVYPRHRQPIQHAGLHRVDVYSGHIGKWQYGNKPHQPDTAIRIPFHGLITHGLGWFPEQSRNAPNYAMRNPNMSGNISYPFKHRRPLGCGGYDMYEIIKWIHIGRKGRRIPGQTHGAPWLRRKG